MKGIRAGSEGDRRLVLGFDAGCATCSDLALRLRQEVGEEIEVLSLGDSQVEGWRERALGEDAPWAPTLFEVRGDDVEAWTGWRMGAHLARLIGTGATWRVMQVLGEYDVVPTTPRMERVASVTDRFSRARFLKGVAGALLAASILSGAKPSAGKASARGWKHPLERVGFESRELLRGAARREALRSAAGSPDVENLWKGSELPARGAFAVRHTLEDGNHLTAVSWTISEEKVLVYYEADRPIGNYRSEAVLLGYVLGEEVWKEAESVNGRWRGVVTDQAGTTDAAPAVQTRACGCCRWRWGCVATVASSCLGCGGTCAICVATPAKWSCLTCLACALVGCPLSIRKCCRKPC